MTYRTQSRTRAALVYLVAVALIVAPLRRAEAFVAPAAAPILITAGGPVAWTIAALSALAAAGTAIWAVKFKDSGGADVASVYVNPKATKPVPVNWDAGANPYDVPNPPATAGAPVTEYRAGVGPWGAWAATRTAAIVAYTSEFIDGRLCSSGAHETTHDHNETSFRSDCVLDAGGYVWQNVLVSPTVGTQSTCPTGYTVSGGTCNLTDAPSVPYPSDGWAQFQTTGGTVQADARDPDNTAPANVTVTGSQVTVREGTTTTTVTINPNGGVTVTSTVPNGDGTSQRTSITTAAPNSGAPDGGANAVGVAQGTVTGEGESASETPAQSCGGAPCATEGTQLANKQLLTDIKNDGLKLKEQGSEWATQKSAAETSITAATAAISAHESKLNTIAGGGNSSGLGVTGLGNYVAPGAGEMTGLESLLPAPASCQALSGSAFGRSWSVDICPVVNATRVVLEWGMYMLTLAYIFFAFLRPRERGV